MTIEKVTDNSENLKHVPDKLVWIASLPLSEGFKPPNNLKESNALNSATLESKGIVPNLSFTTSNAGDIQTNSSQPLRDNSSVAKNQQDGLLAFRESSPLSGAAEGGGEPVGTAEVRPVELPLIPQEDVLRLDRTGKSGGLSSSTLLDLNSDRAVRVVLPQEDSERKEAVNRGTSSSEQGLSSAIVHFAFPARELVLPNGNKLVEATELQWTAQPPERAGSSGHQQLDMGSVPGLNDLNGRQMWARPTNGEHLYVIFNPDNIPIGYTQASSFKSLVEEFEPMKNSAASGEVKTHSDLEPKQTSLHAKSPPIHATDHSEDDGRREFVKQLNKKILQQTIAEVENTKRETELVQQRTMQIKHQTEAIDLGTTVINRQSDLISEQSQDFDKRGKLFPELDRGNSSNVNNDRALPLASGVVPHHEKPQGPIITTTRPSSPEEVVSPAQAPPPQADQKKEPPVRPAGDPRSPFAAPLKEHPRPAIPTERGEDPHAPQQQLEWSPNKENSGLGDGTGKAEVGIKTPPLLQPGHQTLTTFREEGVPHLPPMTVESPSRHMNGKASSSDDQSLNLRLDAAQLKKNVSDSAEHNDKAHKHNEEELPSKKGSPGAEDNTLNAAAENATMTPEQPSKADEAFKQNSGTSEEKLPSVGETNFATRVDFELKTQMLQRVTAEAQERIQDAATDFTGLPGEKRIAAKILEVQAEQARDSKKDYTALSISIKDFKSINDTCGHEVGDTLLTAVADSLSRNLRTSDFKGHFRGDTFIGIIPTKDAETVQTILGATEVKLKEENYKDGTTSEVVEVAGRRIGANVNRPVRVNRDGTEAKDPSDITTSKTLIETSLASGAEKITGNQTPEEIFGGAEFNRKSSIDPNDQELTRQPKRLEEGFRIFAKPETYSSTNHIETMKRIYDSATSLRFDRLTGLPGKEYTHKLMEEKLATADRAGETLTYIKTDLIGIGTAGNQIMGEKPTDKLITLWTEKERETLRKNDLIGRTGGDEFDIVMGSNSQRVLRALSEARIYATRPDKGSGEWDIRVAEKGEKPKDGDLVFRLAIGATERPPSSSHEPYDKQRKEIDERTDKQVTAMKEELLQKGERSPRGSVVFVRDGKSVVGTVQEYRTYIDSLEPK